MNDEACISFLQWALPHMNMRWPGFRKVRGQVCKRLGRRLEELHLADPASYRVYLEDNPLEWHLLDTLCRITISRFYRDKGVYNSLCTHVFPDLINIAKKRSDTTVSCWCIGAASGEEPYSVSLLWEHSGLKKQGTRLKILATEVDQLMINRAMTGCYPASSIRELPATIKSFAFVQRETKFCIKEKYKQRVLFLQQDIRNAVPHADFDLILCRNLVFTYFSKELQTEAAQIILRRLMPGGAFVIGIHENLPVPLSYLAPWHPAQSIYRKNLN